MLDLLRPRAQLAVVDAYSDYRDGLPDDVAETEAWLRRRGESRRRGDAGMGIELDPSDDEHWAALRAYAAWSIHVELWAQPYHEQLAALHDCGYSITANLTPGEAAQLAQLVGDVAPVVPLDVVHARGRAEKVRAKAARRAARRARIRALLRWG